MEIVAHDAEDLRDRLMSFLRLRITTTRDCGNAAARITARLCWRWKEEAYRDVLALVERAVIKPSADDGLRNLGRLDRLFGEADGR